jgi:hypothetical protein
MRIHPHDHSGEDESRKLAASEHDLDALLRGLPLSKPSKSLDARIDRLLAPSVTTQLGRRSRRQLLLQLSPAFFAAAAAVIVTFAIGELNRKTVLPTPSQPTVEPTPIAAVQNASDSSLPVELDLTTELALAAEAQAAKEAEERAAAARTPIGLQQTFQQVQDEGIVLETDGTAYRRLHRQAVRQIVVVDPETGERAVVSIPTRELVMKRVEPF